ncbi:MAG TPA: hypothetical protein VMU12_00020 [Candidatus Paceibacterota bacterium]|nr:hypothetical protein [Candidatus Paceibacterota bacterium]
MITLNLFHRDGRPVTDDNELGVSAGSKEHIRIPNAPYACRWCGRDLMEPSCPHGCGSSWIMDMTNVRRMARG